MTAEFNEKRDNTLSAITAYKLMRESYELDGEERDVKLEQIDEIVEGFNGGWATLAVALTNVLTFFLIHDEWEEDLDAIAMSLIRFEDKEV